MREVVISHSVWRKIAKLKDYLVVEMMFSEEAALRRMDRIGDRLKALSAPGDSALCRYRVWHDAGYRCLSFEGWVFAYEVVPEGVIVRDMAHGKLLVETVY